PEAIKTWVYPTNYPLRDYQFNIVMKALHENTLVSLPTGLGKTFIAAVVMFNFYRWFPDLKVVFMAPTKPLVAQQIESCYKVCGIDPKDCVELTGMTQRKLRQELWRSKKVFYITPQILENDLKEGLCSPEYFSLIVVDEAHRAQRAYAYVTVIKEIFKKNPLFRVLALSATPGSTMDKVQAMVTNLNIARIEIRTEEALDIMPYTFQKLVDKRVVPLSPIIEEISENFKNIFRPNLEKLKNKGAFWSTDLEQISHYSLLKARERFRANSHNGGMDSRLAEGDFALCISMVHQLEHLHKYGVTTFSKKIREWIEESKSSEAKYRHQMLNNLSFQKLVSKVEEIVQREDYHQKLMSHPKLELLINKVQEHFNLFDSNSKIMIFAQFRETINEIIQTLSKLGDHVRATPFIGQSDGKASKGLKQKEQIEVIQKFKRGEYNILVCSSIGEEGLDIGEVDFIICYDSTSSPIKLLQRIGRTGRRRDGKVCMLLSKGKEERSFYSSKSYHKTVVKAIQEGKVDYFQQNARMLPQGCIPICEKKNIHIEPYDRLIIKPTRGRGNKYNDNKYKNQLELEEELIDYQLNEDRISLDITKSMINRPTLYYSVKHTPLCYNVVKIFNQIQYLKIRQGKI
ncbi:P-loop containing nucleoside triphosphate hydrolase protein, partial [Neoconidiobolus thromboides FSU 785]